MSEAMSSGAAAESELGSPCMDMLKGEQIAEADLTDSRKLAQELRARYVVNDFGAGARFVTRWARRATPSAPTGA